MSFGWVGRYVLPRRVVLVALVGALVAGALTGTGYVATPLQADDLGAWLLRGSDLVHASGANGVADWILNDTIADPAGTHVTQDGTRVLVIDGDGSVFTIDPVTMDRIDIGKTD